MKVDISAKSITKTIRKEKNGMLIQVHLVIEIEKLRGGKMASKIQELLGKFNDLFIEPQGPLHKQPQDHNIQLAKGSKPSNI